MDLRPAGETGRLILDDGLLFVPDHQMSLIACEFVQQIGLILN